MSPGATKVTHPQLMKVYSNPRSYITRLATSDPGKWKICDQMKSRGVVVIDTFDWTAIPDL